MISEVFNEDNMIGMARYPDKFWDLAIVDPPYGIEINMNMGRRKGKRQLHDPKDWDAKIPSDLYFDEIFRTSTHQIIWGGGNYFPLPLTKSWIFWDKLVPKGVDFADGELAWTSFDKTLVKCTVKYSGFQGMDIGGKIHPTQKPVALYRWLLDKYANPGDKILDTHMGSQSSRIAAHQMGFDYWGWELDAEYYEAGNKRFKQQTAQQTLF